MWFLLSVNAPEDISKKESNVIKYLSQFLGTRGRKTPDAIAFPIPSPILFTSGDDRRRVYRAIKFIDSSDRSAPERAGRSFSHANRACQKLDRPWESESRSAAALVSEPRYPFAAGNGNYRQNTRRLHTHAYTHVRRYPILDIRRLYTPRICVPRILRFNVTIAPTLVIFIASAVSSTLL